MLLNNHRHLSPMPPHHLPRAHYSATATPLPSPHIATGAAPAGGDATNALPPILTVLFLNAVRTKAAYACLPATTYLPAALPACPPPHLPPQNLTSFWMTCSGWNKPWSSSSRGLGCRTPATGAHGRCRYKCSLSFRIGLTRCAPYRLFLAWYELGSVLVTAAGALPFHAVSSRVAEHYALRRCHKPLTQTTKRVPTFRAT